MGYAVLQKSINVAGHSFSSDVQVRRDPSKIGPESCFFQMEQNETLHSLVSAFYKTWLPWYSPIHTPGAVDVPASQCGAQSRIQ
eukprot:1410-Heterococcus_DN1.PRE.6